MDAFSVFNNPHKFMGASKPFAWGFTLLGIGIVVWGIYQGLYVVPADFRQGDAAKIMFVHVPSSWLALFIYLFMASASFISFVWRSPLADICAKSCAPIGAVFTALCLFTGSVWGKPMWGTWWEWSDPRIVSVVILFFFYLGYMAIWQAMETPQKASRAAAILCMVGAINLPVIHYSVEWWNSLHQTTTFLTDKEVTTNEYKWPMYITIALGYLALFGGLTLFNMRAEVNLRRAEMLIQRRQVAA
jgi:heme exporter protein C